MRGRKHVEEPQALVSTRLWKSSLETVSYLRAKLGDNIQLWSMMVQKDEWIQEEDKGVGVDEDC